MPREVYKSVSLETDWAMKIRLYSPEEYREEFGEALRSEFVGAAKAYRPVEDQYAEFPPDRAAGLLDLTDRDYEVDAEHGALLLRRFRPGTAITAIDDLL